jgi:hypothetical protein
MLIARTAQLEWLMMIATLLPPALKPVSLLAPYRIVYSHVFHAVQSGVWQQIGDAEENSSPNVKFTGKFTSSSLGGKYGSHCMVSNDAVPGTVEITFEVPFDDYYEVLFAYCDHSTRSESVKVDVIAANSPDSDATQTHTVDQRDGTTRYDDTIRLGSPRYFNAGKVRVVVYRDAADSVGLCS